MTRWCAAPLPGQAGQAPDALDKTFDNVLDNTDTHQMPDACGVPFQNFVFFLTLRLTAGKHT